MIARPLILGLLLHASSFSEEVPKAVQIAEPPAAMKLEGALRVISSTGQFRVQGGEANDRGNVAALGEEAKDELLRLTEEKDEWKVPVNITLHGKFGDPLPVRTVVMKLLVSEVGYDLRVDAHLSRGVERERLKQAMTAALIYDRALRGLPPAESDSPFLVPPWLVDGLGEATAWRLNQSDRRLYGALFKTGGLFKIDDLFSLSEREFEEMDAAMRAAFRVSSGALVMALLQQPQGKAGFRGFLTEVASFQGEMPALLRKHFPELNLSETSLSKWWALQLANIGGQNLATDVLAIPQTEAALDEALRLSFPTPEGILEQREFAKWPEAASLAAPERAQTVRQAQDALVRLSYRCFPSYRPILAEYQSVLSAIASNQVEGLPARIADLQSRRETMNAKVLRARDYLDWFEITRARETSGAFDDYMRLKERLKANPHRRSDNLSKYLDRMDAIFARDSEDEPAGLPAADLGLPE